MTSKKIYSKDEREYLKQLGRIIFLKRRQNKWTQEDFGRKIDLSRLQIVRMESGENATNVITLRRIAKVFGIKLEELLRQNASK
jgi:transcriptional regulator with XRE-family HTH domain